MTYYDPEEMQSLVDTNIGVVGPALSRSSALGMHATFKGFPVSFYENGSVGFQEWLNDWESQLSHLVSILGARPYYPIRSIEIQDDHKRRLVLIHTWMDPHRTDIFELYGIVEDKKETES